jgi:hypothetical protein
LSPAVTDPDGAAARDIAAIVYELMKSETEEFTQSSDREGIQKLASV